MKDVPAMSIREKEEMMDAYKELFDSFDQDRNGKISADQFRDCLHSQGSRERRRESVMGMIESVGSSSDEELNFEDFVELINSDDLHELFHENQDEVERRSTCFDDFNFYGQTYTPKETEESRRLGLEQIKCQLGLIDEKKKIGWTCALNRCPELVGDSFLIMFLRTEVFHAERAAKRIISYWDKRIQLFGEKKAFLPLTVGGALIDDHVALSIGFLQATGKSDSAGRAILFMDFSVEDKTKYEPNSLIRAVWYAVHVALEDERAQKKGVVILVRCGKYLGQWDIRAGKEMANNMKSGLPMRLACFHLVHPPSFVGVLVKIGRVLLNKKLSNRIRLHKGSNEEVLEKLNSFGISKDMVPGFWGGSLEFPANLTEIGGWHASI